MNVCSYIYSEEKPDKTSETRSVSFLNCTQEVLGKSSVLRLRLESSKKNDRTMELIKRLGTLSEFLCINIHLHFHVSRSHSLLLATPQTIKDRRLHLHFHQLTYRHTFLRSPTYSAFAVYTCLLVESCIIQLFRCNRQFCDGTISHTYQFTKVFHS